MELTVVLECWTDCGKFWRCSELDLSRVLEVRYYEDM